MTGFVAMFFLGVLLLVIFDALTGDNDRDDKKTLCFITSS